MNEITIVTPPAASQLTTIDAVNAECGTTFAEGDANALRLIKRASAIISRYCGTVFGSGVYSEVFRVDVQHGYVDAENVSVPLFLTRTPLISVTSVTDGYGHVMDLTKLNIDLSLGRLLRLPFEEWVDDRFAMNINPLFRFPVTVVYSAGYEFTDGVDPELEAVALALVSNNLALQGETVSPNIQRGSDRSIGDTYYFDRGGTGLVSMQLTDDMKSMLMPFKVGSYGGDAI